jgi:hypothetical protein
MEKIISFTKMEELRKNKIRRGLLGFISCLLLLTACSRKMVVTTNPEPATQPHAIKNKEQVTLVFFNSENAGKLENHFSIYKRFANAFTNAENVFVLKIDKNEVIEFENNGYYYFHNNGIKANHGMILSNGVDKPIVETNPDRYTKTYESYFGVPFNDKVYYSQKRKAEIAENQRRAIQTLEKRFKIDKSYAAQIIQHSNSSFYPKYAGIARCLTGKVVIKIFEDSAQTKKSPVQLETEYGSNGQLKRNSTFMNNELFSEDVYYRSAYHLIDSIVNTDSKGARSKSVFKYEPGKYSVISVDPKNTMTSHVFYLNDRFQCVKRETSNGSGDLVGSSSFIYDNLGRISIETNETQTLKYEYKNEEDVFATMRSYSTKNGELQTENIRKQDKGVTTQIFKNRGRVFLKNILVTTPDGCLKTAYNYNGDDKITKVYEYSYEH